MESIESTIIRGLLFNKDYTSKVYPHLKTEFFEGTTRTIFNAYSDLYDKYGKQPTVEALLIHIQKLPLNEDVFAETVEAIKDVYQERNEPIDVEWLSDETEQYCVDKAMYNAVYSSIEILEGNDKLRDKHAIPELLNDALSINFDASLGFDYFDDVERRYEYYTNPEARLHMILNALMVLTNGGLPDKTLNVLLAGPNVGKSSLMCFLAGELTRMGKNVLYISGEMSEEAIYERIDANLLDMTTDQLKDPDLDREKFISKVTAIKRKGAGKLIAKEYPTSSAHAGHIDHFLKELKQKRNIVPDIIFVDYLNIFTSSRYKSLNGVNSYSYVKAVAEEMRALAVTHELPIVTATQLNRDGQNNTSPDMTNTSESMGVPSTADWMAAIVTTDELMEMNQQLIIQLKTRYGSKKKENKTQLLEVDFDKMRYYDVGMNGERDSTNAAMEKAKKTKADFDESTKATKQDVSSWQF